MKVQEASAVYSVLTHTTNPKWQRVRLGNVAEVIRGVTYKKEQSFDEPDQDRLPILRATNIQDGTLLLDSNLVYVRSTLVSKTQKLQVGDIVVATSSGSKHLVGKTAQVNQSWEGSFGAFCAAIRPTRGIDHRYLGYFFESREYRDYISKKALGVNINNLRRGDLEELSVPIAPLDQQKRIVAEIEKQFSRLDEAVTSLKRVKANLKRYKAAVLKAAVEGRLVETEAELARRKGRSYETGEQLLQRILETRRSQWKGKGKYKDPATPDARDLPELPEGWLWASLDQVCIKITDGTHHSPKNHPYGEYKYITSKNVKEFRLDLSDITFVDKETHGEIYSRCDVREGDVLYVKDGVNTGLTAKNTLIEPFSLLSSVGVFRTLPEVDSDYLVAYLNSSEVRDRLLANIAGVAITRLTLTKLKVAAIAVPPLAEQHRIVAKVERHLSIIREAEAQVDANLKRAEHMRQAILQTAFSGALINHGKPN